MKCQPVRVAVVLGILCSGAGAETVRGKVVLDDNVWAQGARDSIAGRAMVCNLKSESSFLSLRTEPQADATEITKLNEMTIVELTGETREKWARISGIVIEVASTGEFLPESSRGELKLDGWVHTDYLCNYMY